MVCLESALRTANVEFSVAPCVEGTLQSSLSRCSVDITEQVCVWFQETDCLSRPVQLSQESFQNKDCGNKALGTLPTPCFPATPGCPVYSKYTYCASMHNTIKPYMDISNTPWLPVAQQYYTRSSQILVYNLCHLHHDI
jgi:hypothetical protein